MITTAVHHCGAPLFLCAGGVSGARRECGATRLSAVSGGFRADLPPRLIAPKHPLSQMSLGVSLFFPDRATIFAILSESPAQPNVAGGVALFPGSSDNICDFERMSLSVSLLLPI